MVLATGLSLKERFVRAITFCLGYEGHGGDLEALATWVLSPGDGTAPGDTTLKIAVVAGGATKIKGYVFESARLPEIRGASGLLDRVNLIDVPSLFGIQHDSEQDDDVKAKAEAVREAFKQRTGTEAPNCPECVLYANGGEVLAFAPVSLAPKLADEIEQIYARETLVAQSVAYWEPFTLKQLQKGLLVDENVDDAAVKALLGYNPADNKTFGSLVASLALGKFRRRDANRDKGRTPELRGIAHFETVPFARRCSSCERRGSVVNSGVADKDLPLCEPCARKRVFGQLAKKKRGVETINWWYDAKFQWRPGPMRSWAQQLMDARPDVGEVQSPDDLDEIGAMSQPQGFIGVVYADGNNMGGLLEKLGTPADYREFAEEVYNTTKNAVFDSLDAKLPFEILSIGGDDLFLIVPAHIALPVACSIANRVEENLKEHPLFKSTESYEWAQVQRCKGDSPNLQSKVSFSTGVVLADAHTPVFYLEELASQLLKTAKHRAKRFKRYGYHGGTVDFLSLKSVTMIGGTVEQFRAAALTRQDKRLQLYARPYTIAEMEAMLESIKLLKRANFPRTQLYRLRESLDTSREQSTVDYLYFLSRDSEVQDQRKNIERLWTPDDGQPLMHPWRKQLEKEKLWETIWYDLVELYDFVPEEEEDHADHHD